MFRRLLKIGMVLLAGSVIALAAQASLRPLHSKVATNVVIFDRPVPWPWGFERPFPWADIQGMWRAADGDMSSYFILKVVRSKDSGQRLLVVRQIDPDTCKVIATGVGYEVDRVVRAQMTNDQGETYRVLVRSFAQADSPRPAIGTGEESEIMVLSIMDVDSTSPAPTIHIQIGKVANSIDLKSCSNQK